MKEFLEEWFENVDTRVLSLPAAKGKLSPHRVSLGIPPLGNVAIDKSVRRRERAGMTEHVFCLYFEGVHLHVSPDIWHAAVEIYSVMLRSGPVRHARGSSDS